MTIYNEIYAQQILNPTSINLGEYVINPYRGCEYACRYCYVRANKSVVKRKQPWGSYVDIRINTPELLEKEIHEKKPQTVLLGSTTECFQPVETRYHITAKILEILNRHGIQYVILTRSPLITDYLHLLRVGCCKAIYFTVNTYNTEIKQCIEPRSPSLESRTSAVLKLHEQDVPVIPYVSPLMPWVSDIRAAFEIFKPVEYVEFECLNFSNPGVMQMIDRIKLVDPDTGNKYSRMCGDKEYYEAAWKTTAREIEHQSSVFQLKYQVHFHESGEYFRNTY